MTVKDRSALLLVLALVLPMASIAEQQLAANADLAKMSMTELRRDMYDAEEAFYTLFNQLNDEPEFEVHCFYERPTGTRIKNHVCRAQFVSEAYAAKANRGRGDMTRMANLDADPEMAKKSRAYEEKVASLVAGNPELEAALVRYTSARARLTEKVESNSRRK